MSWSELERLVERAERDDGTLRRALGHCRSIPELVLAARQLGFTIESCDLREARLLHPPQESCPISPAPARRVPVKPR